ncbi:uncharacterized protein LOC105693200 [Athalia rosae]|uniref:uncharacterized protein LOC105693200 n=1 Tax=Athalia rosae TaxID=37344 RepID=UPI0020338736|nr:uncharacterized protein LOC105693200 [Athalia rosae]
MQCTFALPRAQQVTCISEASIQLCATWCSYSSAIRNKELIFYAQKTQIKQDSYQMLPVNSKRMYSGPESSWTKTRQGVGPQALTFNCNIWNYTSIYSNILFVSFNLIPPSFVVSRFKFSSRMPRLSAVFVRQWTGALRTRIVET